jgi:hypothetical protein
VFKAFKKRNLLGPRDSIMDPDQWIEKWLPHATIAKTSADWKNGRKIKFHRELVSTFRTAFDGHQVSLDRVDLLEMTQTDCDGYYKSHGTIRFLQREI